MHGQSIDINFRSYCINNSWVSTWFDISKLHYNSVSEDWRMERCLDSRYWWRLIPFPSELWELTFNWNGLRRTCLLSKLLTVQIQANNGLDLNQSAKHGPMNGYIKLSHLFWERGSSRLGLNMVTNIASIEIKRLFRWVTVQFWRYLKKAKRDHIYFASLHPLLSIKYNCSFFNESAVVFGIEVARWYIGWKHKQEKHVLNIARLILLIRNLSRLGNISCQIPH